MIKKGKLRFKVPFLFFFSVFRIYILAVRCRKAVQNH